MEIIGKLQMILPEQRGESARGPWVRGGFVIETQEQYPRKVCFTLFGEDRVNMVRNIAIGTDIKVFFSIESREFQGRWYTDLRANDVNYFTSAMPQQPQYQAPQPQYQQPAQSQYQAPQQMPTSNPNMANNYMQQMPQGQPSVPQNQPIANTNGSIETFADGASEEDLPF